MVWRFYGLIVLMLLTRSWIDIPHAQLSPMDVLDIPVTLVGLSGLFAYAFRKRWLVPIFWQVWVFAQIGWDVSYNIVGPEGLSHMIIVLAIALPLYAALFLYGYRSRPLWAQS